MDEQPAHPALLDSAYHFGASYAGVRSEVKQVRDFLGKILAGHLCCDDAVLLGSEAATNAIQHSRSAYGTFDVRLWLPDAGPVLFAVRDSGGLSVPLAQPESLTEETGRGVALFNALAEDAESFLHRWGFCHTERQTTVWFELMP